MFHFLFKQFRPRVAISMMPMHASWGGSSPFVWQLQETLRRRGYEVVYDLRKRPDLVVVIDPRTNPPAKRFGLRELVSFRKENPGIPIVHRINECDQRKGTNDIDALLRETNALCDHTIFIAEWLRDYFSERWFNVSRPHDCIYNGADPRVFHPIGYSLPAAGEPVRIVTHHWSDNMRKGFDIYQELDSLIARKKLSNVELHVIGRWPKSMSWQAAKLFKPASGVRLARQLRACHIYLTASRWEPCGMHHVEGAQCGLPLLYHEDGGGIVEAGLRYGLGFRDDLAGAVTTMIERLPEYHAKVLQQMPSGDRMVIAYADIIQRLIAESRR